MILALYQIKASIVMNKKLYTSTTLILLAPFALLLSACDSGQVKLPLDKAPLAGTKIGGPFTLTDQDGKSRSWDSFKGQWRIVYFGYTSCPDICTPDMQNLMSGLKMYAAQEEKLATHIQPIFITVDPARDTPDVLKQFVGAFHPKAIGLTGTPDQIADAAQKFAVYFSAGENGLVNHTQTPFLMDPNGKPIAILPADQPGTQVNEGRPELVANELAKWVQ